MEFKKSELIGEGVIAKIYLKEGYAYKKFKLDSMTSWIHYEFDVHKEVEENTQLNVVKYYEVLDDSIIKMEYIKGMNLSKVVRNKMMTMPKNIEVIIDIQQSIHAYTNLKLQNAHEVYKKKIENSSIKKEIKNVALKNLNKIEKMNILCHLDIHYENIMFDGHRYYIIDWSSALLANPVFDIARTYVIFKQYVKRQANNYLKKALERTGITKEEFERALFVVVAIRVIELGNHPFSKELLTLITYI
ncbi:MAG: phosphotransferase [Coprobacillaceae bacterium]